MATVTINRQPVDQDDPCALYRALYAAKLRFLSGESVEELSIQSPVTRETVRFSPSNMKALDDELMRLARACEAKSGRRARFAKSMTFRG